MASVFDDLGMMPEADEKSSPDIAMGAEDGMEALASELLAAFEARDTAALASILRSLKGE